MSLTRPPGIYIFNPSIWVTTVLSFGIGGAVNGGGDRLEDFVYRA